MEQWLVVRPIREIVKDEGVSCEGKKKVGLIKPSRLKKGWLLRKKIYK